MRDFVTFKINGKRVSKPKTITDAQILRKQALKKRTPSEILAEAIFKQYFTKEVHFEVEYIFEFRRFDFYFPSIKVVIEIDGGYHGTAEQLEKDRVFDKYLRNKHKIRVIRVKNEMVRQDIHKISKELLPLITTKFENKEKDDRLKKEQGNYVEPKKFKFRKRSYRKFLSQRDDLYIPEKSVNRNHKYAGKGKRTKMNIKLKPFVPKTILRKKTASDGNSQI